MPVEDGRIPNCCRLIIVVVYVYNGAFFFDSECTTLLNDPLYNVGDDYFLDPSCTCRVALRDLQSARDDLPDLPDLPESHVSTNAETRDDLPESHVWTDAETRFLLVEIEPHLQLNGQLPATLAELEQRMKWNRGKKSKLWEALAKRLCDQFSILFSGKQVSRKWFTLVDGYKKAIANNGSTGQGPSRFKWVKEMSDLIGGQHDVNLVLTGTEAGVTIHRPDELSLTTKAEINTSKKPEAGALSQKTGNEAHMEPGSSQKAAVRNRRTKRKADESADELLKFMRESEERSSEFENKLLAEISDMASTIKKMVDKL